MMERRLMMNKCSVIRPFAIAVAVFLSFIFRSPVSASPAMELNVSMTSNGIYTVGAPGLGWYFRGILPNIAISAQTSGKDALGDFTLWNAMTSSGVSYYIKEYPQHQAVLFSWTASQTLDEVPQPFPDFKTLPSSIHVLSYLNAADGMTASFSASQSSTPWVIFNDSADVCVISPASGFFISKMYGDAINRIGVGIDNQTKSIPAGYSQGALMVFGHGIEPAMRSWGALLEAIGGQTKSRTSSNSPLLHSLGFWTDNPVSSDPRFGGVKKFTAGLMDQYESWKDSAPPMGYIELGSWWYPKGGVVKTRNGEIAVTQSAFGWRGIDGAWTYSASPESLSEGLDPFSRRLNLPLVAQGSWIDPKSPYRQMYKISGVAPLDNRYWDDLAQRLSSSGVICYEQDCLASIYAQSPALAGSPGAGEMFTDQMSSSFSKYGGELIYEQASPRFYMQASRYPNVVAIRGSNAAFTKGSWDKFLYSSLLARSVGSWPWSGPVAAGDVQSQLISILSGGPVGVIGSAGASGTNPAAPLMRSDGVLIKPDESLTPFDTSILSDSEQFGHAMTAWTYSGSNIRTGYVVSYTRPGCDDLFGISLSAMGYNGALVYAYDYNRGRGYVFKRSENISGHLGDSSFMYCIIAPIGASGVAMLGDLSKFVSCGSARIPMMSESNGQLTMQVELAHGEENVTLSGYAISLPVATVDGAQIDPIKYDEKTKLFSITAHLPKDEKAPDLRAFSLTFTCKLPPEKKDAAPAPALLPDASASAPLSTGEQNFITLPNGLTVYDPENVTTVLKPGVGAPTVHPIPKK